MHYALYTNQAQEIVWWEPHSAQAEVPAGVPGPIVADYKEAQLALGYELYKAAAVMFRRSVQGAAIDKGAPIEKRLRDQIDWLAANGRITGDMKDWAHELRLFGNAGAHPGDDLLENVSAAEAADSFAFARAFLDYLYVMPDRIARAREARASA